MYRYDDNTEAKNIEKYKDAFKKYEEEKQAYPNKLKQWEQQHQARQAQQSLLDKASLDQKNSKQKKAGTVLPKEEPRPKEPKEPNAENWGHIDVRTYDGYISDFKTQVLPPAANDAGRKAFVVTGIYRKIYDPLPDLRVRAFLKVLREWENHGIADDEQRYFSLYRKATDKTQPFFSDTTKHPFEGVDADNTPAGAYQIILDTYRRLVNARFGIGPGFSQLHQDRLAVALIEALSKKDGSLKQGDALTMIRTGQISEATRVLNAIWASLPGTKQSRKDHKTNKAFSIDDVVERHKCLMNELMEK